MTRDEMTHLAPPRLMQVCGEALWTVRWFTPGDRGPVSRWLTYPDFQAAVIGWRSLHAALFPNAHHAAPRLSQHPAQTPPKWRPARRRGRVYSLGRGIRQ